MSPDTWLLYAVATLLLSLTPGPNGLLALSHGARYGARRTAFTAAGGVAGFALLIGASMSGLGALLMTSGAAFELVRWAGALYLVWLGVRTWRSPPTRPDPFGAPVRSRTPRGLFSEGFVVALSNPKALLFFAAFLPQFLDPEGSLLLQFAIMAGTLIVLEFAVEMALAAGASHLLPWLSTERVARRFARGTGALFVAAGASLVVADR